MVFVEKGWEIVCAENEFHRGKFTGFTNHRFGLSKRNRTWWYLSIDGKTVKLSGLVEFRCVLRREIQKMKKVCPPLVSWARDVLKTV